jgi:diguanylate cyclase (GGDEF)-like protein/PAS domain S-box-containing protein
VNLKAWKWYLAGGALGGLAYYFIPPMAKSGPFFNVLGASSVVAIVVGTRMHRPARRLPWYLFATGQALFIMGDVITYNYPTFFHHDIPFPSIGDVFYLGVYPCLIAGILVLVRERSPGGDRDGLIDSLIISIGAGLLSWEFLMSPYARDFSLTFLVKVTSIAYPMMDVLLLAVVVRLAVAGGRRGPAFYLLVFGTVALLATDAAYGMIQLSGVIYENGGPLEAGWLSFYLLWGAAALHPSMRSLSEAPPKERIRRFSRTRLALLTGSTLMAPLVLAIQHYRHEPLDIPIAVTASMCLFLLAMARMNGLVRTHEVAEGRERALRRAGASLVAAADREELYRAAIEATQRLVGDDAEVWLALTDSAPEEFRVVARGRPQAEGDPLEPPDRLGDDTGIIARSSLPAELFDALASRGWFEMTPPSEEHRRALGVPESASSLSLAPLSSKGELSGLLLVATPDELSTTTLNAVSALASQVALAVESANLGEDLMRRRSEARFASLVQNSSDVITIIDPDTKIRYQSPSITHVLGYEPEPMVGTRLLDFIHPDDADTVLRRLAELVHDPVVHAEVVEFRMRHRDGAWREVETLWSDLSLDREVGGVVLNTRDISERKVFERQLAYQAFHDSITGLANRALFRDRVEHALARQQRDDRAVAVLFMDIDDFKTINDSLGHAAGDILLSEVGKRLKDCLRAADTPARLGGDEFAVLLEDSGYARAAEVAGRVMRMLEKPILVEGKEVFARASIGIAIGDHDRRGPDGAEEILRNADVAMYTAKSSGKGHYQVFEPAMHSAVLQRLELKADLQRAVDKHEFVLHYQPVVILETGEISGLEALVRWMHPERGLLPPMDFIPLAEETGLIVRLGQWILEEACNRAADLQVQFPRTPPLTMSVNLSARQLQHHDLIGDVERVLSSSGISPGSLVLEITETAMMQDTELAIIRLNDLKRLGVKLAIDDFGTGYSSLNYLRRFPVDILKVDRSFIEEINSGGDQSALTASIIELAGTLRLRPVAEGVERVEQLQRLLSLNCELGQGFYFARALDEEELRRVLAAGRVPVDEQMLAAGTLGFTRDVRS